MKYAFGLAALALVASGCGGDNKSSLQAPAANLNGTWQVTTTISTNTCGEKEGSETIRTVTIIHPAGSNSFTITEEHDTPQVSGTIDGSKVSFSTSTPTAECTTFAITTNVTLDETGNAATGSTTFTCTYTGGSCTGTQTVTATRQ